MDMAKSGTVDAGKMKETIKKAFDSFDKVRAVNTHQCVAHPITSFVFRMEMDRSILLKFKLCQSRWARI